MNRGNGKIIEYSSADGRVKSSKYVRSAGIGTKTVEEEKSSEYKSADGSVGHFKYVRPSKRLLLIDGDNNIDCLEGIREIKGQFSCIKCWTVTAGNVEKIKNYGIDAEIISYKPQAVDLKIKEYLKENKSKYSEIFIFSHDKGFSDVLGDKVKRVRTVDDLKYNIDYKK